MELKIKIDVQGALLKGKAPEIIKKNLEGAITKATMLLHAEVIKRTPQGVSPAGSGLLHSIKGDVVQKGTLYVKGIVGTANPYGEVVEKGRAAGKGIPIDALTVWVQRKLGITDPETVRKVSIIISSRAKRYGIKGAHMFENALNENMDKIEAIFKKAGFDMAKELSE